MITRYPSFFRLRPMQVIVVTLMVPSALEINGLAAQAQLRDFQLHTNLNHGCESSPGHRLFFQLLQGSFALCILSDRASLMHCCHFCRTLLFCLGMELHPNTNCRHPEGLLAGSCIILKLCQRSSFALALYCLHNKYSKTVSMRSRQWWDMMYLACCFPYSWKRSHIAHGHRLHHLVSRIQSNS